MTRISKTRVNWPILGRKEWLESLGKDSNLFFHATYQENHAINEEITQPINKSHNLSRNHATSWDSSQDSNPWWRGLGLTRIFFWDSDPALANVHNVYKFAERDRSQSLVSDTATSNYRDKENAISEGHGPEVIFRGSGFVTLSAIVMSVTAAYMS